MKPFSIECKNPFEQDPTVCEVSIVGFLDAHTVVTFEQTIKDLLESDINKIVLDLENLNYISSAGIGSIMSLLQQLRRADGNLILYKPTTKVFKVLEMLGFTKIFQIAEDHERALDSLGQGAKSQ